VALVRSFVRSLVCLFARAREGWEEFTTSDSRNTIIKITIHDLILKPVPDRPVLNPRFSFCFQISRPSAKMTT